MNKIKVVVAGPRGKMGLEAVKMTVEEEELELIGCIDNRNDGKELKDIEGMPSLEVLVYENPETCLKELKPDVLIDLTSPEVGYKHTKLAVENGVRPVVGTTGFTEQQLEELKKLAEEKKTGVVIAPNFALGAVLMMEFSRMAAKYFEDVEIIERHHDNKLDAPSGTAVKTAQLIKEERQQKKQGHPDEKETLAGARGADYDGMRIHSVRLPGLVAHQEVVFGAPGQNLTIKHDSFDRKSFMSGVKLAIDHVIDSDTLVYGLENLLD